MFTGIINHLGKFVGLARSEGYIFEIPPKLSKQISIGLSIAIDGVCLTVKKVEKEKIYVDVMPETADKTILGKLKPHSLVNLELPVTTETFFSGHLVQGHVDGKAKLESIRKKGDSHIFKFSVPKKLSRYIVEKGSIAINGISLTVIKVGKEYFTVGIIPFTWNNTMLQTIKIDDFVNIEVDILAKYLERLSKK